MAGAVVVSYLLIGNIEIAFEQNHLFREGTIQNSPQSIGLLKIILLTGKLGVVIINPLIIAGFGLVWLRLSHIELPFRNLLSLMLYGEAIFYLGILLSAVITYFTGQLNPFSLEPLTLTQGYQPSSLMFFLASKANLFFILEIVIVGIGFSRFTDCTLKTGLKLSILSVGLLTIITLFIKLFREYALQGGI